MTNPNTNAQVVYKYKVKGKVLKLTLMEDDKEAETNAYDSVDELQMKTLADLIGDSIKDNLCVSIRICQSDFIAFYSIFA